MKVSDPIIFGHAVRAYFKDLFAARADLNPNNGLASLPQDDPQVTRGDRAGVRERPRARDGRLRPRHHQPARAERRDHRRVDAGDDPQLGPDVERGRRAAGRQGRHPRLQLRRAVRGDDRVLPRARRVRPGDDGHDAERRPDGAEGRGVRQPRQDLRDRRRRHRARRRRRRSRAARARGRARRPLARLPDQGRARRRLGPARGRARPRDRVAGRLLARRDPGPRRADPRQGPPPPPGPRHRRAADRDPPRGGGDPLHARARLPRRGHDLGHRQRPARLPDRPVPDPRARHEREDALDRAADERRRACSRPAPAARPPSTCSSS